MATLYERMIQVDDLRLSQPRSVDFGAADLQQRAAPVSLERNQIHIQFDSSATSKLLGQRKAEALRFGWVGCFEFGIREHTEAADLLLRSAAIPLDLHDSLDSTIVRRPKGRHTDNHARGLARHPLVSRRRPRGSDHRRAGDGRNRWTILRRNEALRH